jgi:effector-binding domain-containing protein
MTNGVHEMNIQIINQPKTITLYGFSKVHEQNKARGDEMMELLGQVWAEVGEKKLTSTGINHAVYDCGDIVFSGLELTSSDEIQTSLVKKEFTFPKYAYWKHVGPYSEFGNVYGEMHAAIKELGFTNACPSMEIYGHWTDDESKLETEIFITLA